MKTRRLNKLLTFFGEVSIRLIARRHHPYILESTDSLIIMTKIAKTIPFDVLTIK